MVQLELLLPVALVVLVDLPTVVLVEQLTLQAALELTGTTARKTLELVEVVVDTTRRHQQLVVKVVSMELVEEAVQVLEPTTERAELAAKESSSSPTRQVLLARQ